MNNPLISVIIPVFNGERFIAEAIQSVLKQEYKPLEIIVIDDGSTDGTADLVKIFEGNIRYFYQPNAGISSARNKGLELAKGELISFIDADDVWAKNKLEIQTRLFENNPEAELVIGFLVRSPFIGCEKLWTMNPESMKGIFATQLGSTLIKNEVFQKVGLFDEEMQQAEDLDWLMRVREAGIGVLVHKDIVQFYTMHDKNVTNDRKLSNFYMLKAYKKSLDRRRKSGNESFLNIPKLGNFDELFEYWHTKS
jgi:glycosyltransferase involved in cell wall biosynthesis